MRAMKRLSSMAALAVVALASLDLVAAFLSPTSSLSRVITANQVSFPKVHFKSSRTTLFMSEVVADSKDNDPLFEPCGVGIKRDYSKRLPLYKSDITDGLNVQVRTKLCLCGALSVSQCD